MHISPTFTTSEAPSCFNWQQFLLLLSNAQNDGTSNNWWHAEFMKQSISRWSAGSHSAAHVCMDPAPTAFSASCAQILGPEIRTVTKCNTPKADSSGIFPLTVTWSVEVTLVLLILFNFGVQGFTFNRTWAYNCCEIKSLIKRQMSHEVLCPINSNPAPIQPLRYDSYF